MDGFRFWDYPILLPDTCPEETNVYDMRLTKHEDGYIYGVFSVSYTHLDVYKRQYSEWAAAFRIQKGSLVIRLSISAARTLSKNKT